jgi:hypothetical protein
VLFSIQQTEAPILSGLNQGLMKSMQKLKLHSSNVTAAYK